jgi:tetratricopeptide (TPR) repeat protein
MRALQLAAAIFISLIVPRAAAAGQEQDNALRIQQAIFQRDYALAEKILTQTSTSPTSPLPGLVRMTIMQARMFENFSFSSEGRFAGESQKNEAACALVTEDVSSTPWNLLLCGASDALRAFHYLKTGQSMKAMKVASRGLKALEAAKAKDPQAIDADLGFGLYAYFKSEFFETKLGFIPFVKDGRAAALAKIENVATQGTYGRDLAKFCLAFIALETQKQDLGERMFGDLVQRFPKSVLFRVLYAAFLIKVENYTASITVINDLIKLAPEITAAKYFMGRALTLEGKNLTEAKRWLDEYIGTRPHVSILGPATYLLGLIAEKQGDTATAMTRYKESAVIYPAYKPAMKNLLRLKQATMLKAI